MANQAARGKTALQAKKYDEAIEAYTAALHASPTSPDYFIQRSIAFHRSARYLEALQDAENAVIQAQSRGKKELITDGQFRRGLALYSLGRYGDAEFVLKLVKKRNDAHKEVTIWLSKVAIVIGKLDSDDSQREVTVEETPKPQTESTSHTSNEPTTSAVDMSGTITSTQTQPVPPVPQQTPAEKIRHEWYQNNDTVYFSLLAKGVPKEKAQIEVTERTLSIEFPITNGNSFDFTIDPLHAPVNASSSVVRILPSKVEISMAKKIPGLKWPKLEGTKDDEYLATEIKASAPASTVTGQPTPVATSSAPPEPRENQKKDWDKIMQGNQEGYDSDDGGDAANNFFKTLFKGAGPDAQRAMMKSYTESNGTALSTNWAEVSKGKVETVPPDGMEAKKW